MVNKSILKTMLDKVSNLPWIKSSSPHKNMKPSKGFNKPVSDHAFDYLKELNDEEFEKLIAMIFKQRGYFISDKNENPDADLILKINGEVTFVQYSHWREYKVELSTVEIFSNLIEENSIAHGIIITTGTFTEDALDFSPGKPLLLINGVDLSQMIDVLTSSEQGELEELMSETETEKSSHDEMPELEPLCPICSQNMIKRTAKKGKNAGNTFWGCSQFPNCRGVISD